MFVSHHSIQFYRSVVGLAFALFVGAGAAVAAPLDIYDLRALVSEAAQRHPSVLNARALAGAADAEIQYAQKQRLPELSLSAAAQGQGSTGALTIKQPLWAGGAIDAQEALSRANLEVAQASADEQELTIATRTLEAWRNFVLSQQKITVVDEGMEQLNALIAMMQRRVDAKVSPRVELDLVKARLIQSQVERSTLSAERDLAVRRLEELVGGSIAVSKPPAALLAQWTALMKQGWPRLSSSEMNEVARYQPTVRRVSLEAKSAQKEVQQTEANQWPQVYLQFQQGINAPVTNDKRVVLGVEYTPGRGFSSRQQVDVALARARARDINIQTAVRDARDGLNAKLQAIDRAQALAKSWEPSVAASEALLASYQRQFIAGRKSWQDVLNQQRELNQGRQSLIDSRITWVSTVAELELMRAAKPLIRLPDETWLRPFFDSPAHATTTVVSQDSMPVAVGQKQTAPESAASTPPTPEKVAEAPSIAPKPVSLAAMSERKKPLLSTTTQPEPMPHSQPGLHPLLVLGVDDLFGGAGSMASDLSEKGRKRLSAWALKVRATYAYLDQITVSGFSDPLADVATVTRLSQSRAQAVAAFLRTQGVQTQAWQVEWFGATKPVRPQCGFEDTPRNRVCHGANRRIEIQVEGVTKGKASPAVSPITARGN
jgi:outer membrane protein, adhesin transport system